MRDTYTDRYEHSGMLGHDQMRHLLNVRHIGEHAPFRVDEMNVAVRVADCDDAVARCARIDLRALCVCLR